MNTFIFGAGGHGKVVFDILTAQKVSVNAFIDSSPRLAELLGTKILQEEALDLTSPFQIVVAVGANHLRRKIVNQIRVKYPKSSFMNAIHPSAVVSRFSRIGVGNVIAAGAIVGPDTIVGDHVVINTGAQVDHDCKIGDFVSVAPGAILGGNVSLGTGVYAAMGAKVKHGTNVGEWTVLGVGTAVMKNVPAKVVAYGIPCRVIRNRNEDEPYL